MRLTDEQKQEAIDRLIENYDSSGRFDVLTTKKVDPVTDALEYFYETGPKHKRSRELYEQAVRLLMDFYQNAQDYELVFSRIHDLLRPLDVEQLKMLSTRIEIMAKELEDAD